jgi:hypothetical protein
MESIAHKRRMEGYAAIVTATKLTGFAIRSNPPDANVSQAADDAAAQFSRKTGLRGRSCRAARARERIHRIAARLRHKVETLADTLLPSTFDIGPSRHSKILRVPRPLLPHHYHAAGTTSQSECRDGPLPGASSQQQGVSGMSILHRRNFITGTGLALAALPLTAGRAAVQTLADGSFADPRTLPGPDYAQRGPLAPVKASLDRLISLEVCTRPFRPLGPRIEREDMGRKAVIHNYGHGGSGWSLSWGAARRAVALAKGTGENSIAIIGCGAIGLTTAVEAQRAGLKVRIYTKEFFPYVRSFRATGVWSPSARIVALPHATPEFRRIWEEMARYSYFRYSSLLGLPGNPVEWSETYKLSDTPFAAGSSLYTHSPYPGEPDYPHLEDEHTPDLMTRPQDLLKGQHPFPVAHARRMNTLMFNIPAYTQMLMESFVRKPSPVCGPARKDDHPLHRLCRAGAAERRQPRPRARPDRPPDPAAGGELRHQL